MTSIKISTLVPFICSLFIFLFVYTALSKFLDFQAFISVLGRSPLIGSAVQLVAWGIPLAELVVSLLLLLPATRRTGIWSAFVLMCLFTAYVGYMVIFVPHLPCSCGGLIQELSWKGHLILNFILTVIAAAAVFEHKIFVATDRGNRKPVTE